MTDKSTLQSKTTTLGDCVDQSDQYVDLSEKYFDLSGIKLKRKWKVKTYIKNYDAILDEDYEGDRKLRHEIF